MPYNTNAKRKAYIAKYRMAKKIKMMEYLSLHPCVDCGETDPVVLECDHLPKSDKRFEVGRAITSSSMSWRKVLSEIKKCDIVCANCHRRRTARRAKQYRLTCVHSSADLEQGASTSKVGGSNPSGRAIKVII